jgi:hypothetical protein
MHSGKLPKAKQIIDNLSILLIHHLCGFHYGIYILAHKLSQIFCGLVHKNVNAMSEFSTCFILKSKIQRDRRTTVSAVRMAEDNVTYIKALSNHHCYLIG